MTWLTLILVVIILVILIAVLIKSHILPVGLFKTFFGGKTKKISLTTQEPWFSEIKSGRKKVEARYGPPTLYKEFIGKKIAINVPGGEKLKAIIKAVRHYKTLKEYLKAEKWDKVAPHVKSESEAEAAYLAIKNKKGIQVYDPARVETKDGGITAIEFELIK